MKKICIISSDPHFLGGVSLYTWNIVNYLKNSKKYDIFWVYGGKRTRIYRKDGVSFVELKSPFIYPINEVIFNFKIKEFLDKNNFEIINSHAIWGFWMKFYRKKQKQKIVHIYHGSTYHFFKNHFKRPGMAKKGLSLLSVFLGFIMEKPPWKKSDKIICVSEHVKKELEGIYGKRKNVSVLSANVNLNQFKPKNRNNCRKKLGLDQKKWYGLYVGRGGYWTKGLDRVISLSQEIYKKDRRYRLIVLGTDEGKVKSLMKKEFIAYFPSASRERIPYFYNSSDIFFNLSRYEGGDPTLSTGEAMASGCLVVCSKDSKQEVIRDEKNGLVIEEDYKKAAEKVLDALNDKKRLKTIIEESVKTIRKVSKLSSSLLLSQYNA